MRRVLRSLVIASVVVVATASVGFAQCVTGNVTSELQTSGPFAGLYKYTVNISWDIPQGLSNVTYNCSFLCSSVCGADWQFDTPAGQMNGTGECGATFDGEFNCDGNPSIGLDGPVVKWDGGGDCNNGSATLCFYTDLPPAPDGNAPVILIKNGQNVCEGTVSGDCPTCPVAVDLMAWGALKAAFR